MSYDRSYEIRTEILIRQLGIDWMTTRELALAIPPAYTSFIGDALMAYVRSEVAA